MKRHGPRVELSTSEMEAITGESVLVTLDPKRAHKAAGDPGYEAVVPQCGLCQAQALAAKAAEEFIE